MAGGSGRSPRRRLVAACAAIAVVAIVATALALNWPDQKQTTSLGQPRSPAATTTSGGTPASATTAATATSATTAGTDLTAGNYPINKQLYADATMTITLASIQVSAGGAVTATVEYRNTGILPVALQCDTVPTASVDTLTRTDGTVFKATHSYCSDHPGTVSALLAGGTSASYATFAGVSGRNGPFTFSWQTGQSMSGTVSGIVL
jgi:hypothetical protein